ncbi:MAG TPA: NAD-dependent epimerase/dehydratase family protein [Drouetiella sp.]|jgi:nucleoside-diphosphate-sugar epimerase
MSRSLVLLGVGNVAIHVARCVSSYSTIHGTTRTAERIDELRANGIDAHLIDHQPSIKKIVDDNDVLVSFPPDGVMDAALAAQCIGSRRIIYISSTGVYGKVSGRIDENSNVDGSEPSAARRLQAEEIWRNRGAVVLRCPGLYASETGMHLRLNQIKIPGDGSNYVSRIHLDDLARIICACFEKDEMQRDTYVVGDLHPSTHLETITWLCRQLNAPLPDLAPLSEVSPTLRGNRQIDSSCILQELQISLHYPSYKEGYSAILASVNPG